MTKVLLYDNSFTLPQDVSNLLGVNRFSDIYYRKRSLDQWISGICFTAGIKYIEIDGKKSGGEVIKQLGVIDVNHLVIMYLPAFIAFGCSEEDASLFLRKLSLTRSSLLISSEPESKSLDHMQIAVAVGELAHTILQSIGAGENLNDVIRSALDQIHLLDGDVSMIDMRDPLHFTDYLTSNFDVRYFNSIQSVNDFVVLKRSSDVDKLRREFQYYGLLPPDLQMFFIQPYDFSYDKSGASYKMERLFIPDMALQWIHGSLDETALKRFMDKIFYYIFLRRVRHVDANTAREVHYRTYKDKVANRIDQMKGKSEYKDLQPYIDTNFGGLDAMFTRYSKLLDKISTHAVSSDLVIGHGDLCFSNILYSKITGIMRFIDPRGANDNDDLYACPFYDLAKLSHSIIGNYDFINYGLYRLEIDAKLNINLHIDMGAPSWARIMYEERLHNAGFYPPMIRLFEVSLFLSMLPLHIDSPKKVLAFIVNANQILCELEQIL